MHAWDKKRFQIITAETYELYILATVVVAS